MKKAIPLVLLFLAVLVLQGCAFHSLAKHWHGRIGDDGEPVYFVSTTKVGLNLFIAITLLGDTGIDGLVDDLTNYVADENGDYVRIVQGTSENYWYGFPPFTWILTPVISTVAADYRPSPEVLARDLEEMLAEEADND